MPELSIGAPITIAGALRLLKANLDIFVAIVFSKLPLSTASETISKRPVKLRTYQHIIIKWNSDLASIISASICVLLTLHLHPRLDITSPYC